MTIASPHSSELAFDAYLVLGVATCFFKEEGQVQEIQVIEPIPSAALEALLKGIPTSYSLACGTTLGDVIVGDTLQVPSAFPADLAFCEDFIFRAQAAARTYQSRPVAQAHLPVGTTYQAFNFSTERKRVLNAARVVKTEDNVKQHSYTHQVL
jgi:hypothetical protein